MDCAAGNNEVSVLNEHKDTKSDSMDSKKETRSSHEILKTKDSLVCESDDNRQLLCNADESASLEYSHKYANRIKSFLGWDTDVDELEDKNTSEEFSKGVFDTNDDSYDTILYEKQDSDIYLDAENLETPKKFVDIVQESQDTFLQTDGKFSDSTSQSKIKGIENDSEPKQIDDNDEETPLNSFSGFNSGSASPLVVTSDVYRMENACSVTELEESSNSANCTPFHNTSNNETTKESQSGSSISHVDLKKDDKIGDGSIEMLVTGSYTRDYCNESSLSSLDIKQNEQQDKTSFENVLENSENSNYINLDENDLLKKSIKKPYMDGIRRLSMDIVREVIESARNSVHEICTNKSVEEVVHQDNSSDRKVADNNGARELEKDSMIFNLNTLNAPMEDDGKFQSEFTDSKNNSVSMKNKLNQEKCFEDEETVCGFGCFKPKCIQRYATPKVFLLFFAIIGVINGAYYSYNVSIISTLEKRFAFRSKVSGTILLADEITPLILGIFVGYFGGKTHRPRMIALGMLCAAACCFISGLPYLIYKSSNHLVLHSLKNETGPEFCKDESKSESCSTNERPPTLTVVGIFLLASFLKGFGTLSYHIIGISYLDDVIKRKNSPFYFAISLALRLLGPLVGFLMSSAFLKIYENPFDDPGFGTDDPRWIGAWWMGFFLQGVLLLIFTIPIALFPRRLPGQKRLEKHPTTPQSENIRETLAGLFLALKRLAKNPIFIIVIINTTMKIFGHFGHSIMLPKYMENQFRLSAADASLFSGATSIFCIMIATIIGGFLIWKYRPRIKLLLAGMVVSEVMLCIGFLILMIPRCQPADLSHFGMNDEGLILNSVCNQNCDCSKTSFTPFCGPDGKTTYFSPCYAGCTEELTPLLSSKKQKEFGNCSCVNYSTNSSDSKITEGFCPDDNCWSQALAYLIILFILLTLSNTFTVAHTMILLRSVHPADKSVALGTFETCICLFGFIPFPVTFGALVDSACLIWEESCGETGNCWFYDMDRFAFLLHGAAALFCSFSVVCLITIYVLSSRIMNLYEEEKEEEQNVDNIKLDTTSGSVTAL